jgi:hypothetical protein
MKWEYKIKNGKMVLTGLIREPFNLYWKKIKRIVISFKYKFKVVDIVKNVGIGRIK